MAKGSFAKILVPADGPDAWRPLLADPEKHWKRGYSARALAYCWHDGGGFPKAIKDVLERADDFRDLKFLLAIPEHRVPLPPIRTQASQNDLWVLARCSTGLISIAVEGKVAESFGPTLKEWKVNPTSGKKRRLEFISSLLGLDENLPGEIRYQLLHRTASAVIEAQNYFAHHAVMMVHSFSQSDQWFDDYARFVGLFGGVGVQDKVVTTKTTSGVRLHFAWVRGEAKYLNL